MTMAKRLTDRQAYELYRRVWPGDDPWDTTDAWQHARQKSIAAEVRAMLAAPTLDEAFKVCEWWIIDNDDAHPLRRDVARLRRLGSQQVRR